VLRAATSSSPRLDYAAYRSLRACAAKCSARCENERGIITASVPAALARHAAHVCGAAREARQRAPSCVVASFAAPRGHARRAALAHITRHARCISGIDAAAIAHHHIIIVRGVNISVAHRGMASNSSSS